MIPTNDQDQRALDRLVRLIEQGVEYPDAEWHVFMATGVPTSELRAMYDTWCATPKHPREIINKFESE